MALPHSAPECGSSARPVSAKLEWPAASGPADYGVFVSLQCVGMVEAKRRNKSDCGALGQSEGYSKDITLEDGEAADASQPACGASGEFRVHFVFYTNGRPYLKQIETESGISFRDARKPTNLARGLIDWPTPDGLQGQLGIDINAADAASRRSRYSSAFRCGGPIRTRPSARLRSTPPPAGAACSWPWPPAPTRPSSPSRCATGR